MGCANINAGCDHAEGTVFAVSVEELKHVRSEGGEILTEPFLHVCKGLLALLGLASICFLDLSNFPGVPVLRRNDRTSNALALDELKDFPPWTD